MSFFDTVLGVPLGFVLFGAYRLVGSYGWAIILFTVATKVILLPLSVMARACPDHRGTWSGSAWAGPSGSVSDSRA